MRPRTDTGTQHSHEVRPLGNSALSCSKESAPSFHLRSSSITSSTACTSAPRRRCDSFKTAGLPPWSARNILMSMSAAARRLTHKTKTDPRTQRARSGTLSEKRPSRHLIYVQMLYHLHRHRVVGAHVRLNNLVARAQAEERDDAEENQHADHHAGDPRLRLGLLVPPRGGRRSGRIR